MATGLLVVILASGFFVTMPASGVTVVEPSEWTIAVYGDADNNLEGAWDKYTDPALLGIPTNDKVKVVAALDRYSTSGAEVIEYAYGTSVVLATYDEKNFGAWETLVWFLEDVAATYPSDKLAVILWDHGGGWWGVCWDDTDGGYISANELQNAVTTAGVYIDVLGFDACMMSSVEVVYGMYQTGLVGMMVASEQLVPYNGFPYDLMFAPLTANPEETREQVADDMVAGWGMYYGNKGWVDLSALNVTILGEIVTEEFTAWVGAMQANLMTNSGDYAFAFKKSEMVKRWYICDVNIFANTMLADRDVADPALRDATMALKAAVDLGVNLQSGGGKTQLSGITFWFGIGSEYTNYGPMYQTLSFAGDTGWYDFVSAFNAL